MNKNIGEVRHCDDIDNSVSEINVSLFLMKSISARPGELSENDVITANNILIGILEKCSARLEKCSARLLDISFEVGDTE